MGVTFLLRNPRYALLLTFTLLFTIVILSPAREHVDFKKVENYFKSSETTWLKDALREEEERYELMLRDRAAMINKYGPTPERVEAFPPGMLYTLWDFYIPAFQCPHRVERLGTMGDGGKWVCGFKRVAKQPECVIYSFGINGESSFEATLLTQGPTCQVWGYDFSVSSFGPEIESIHSLKSRSHFSAVGLGAQDAPSESPPLYTLKSLMEANGHKWIDVLKIDIEGAEFDSLVKFIDDFTVVDPSTGESTTVLPVGQMQLEIHAREWSGYGDFAHFNAWWEKLEKAGLRPFWTEANLVYINIFKSGVRPDLVEYSFMNIRGDHALVSDKFN
ncbi:methyltransferase domain-containing protein [Cristinia sonorae]|uniref:Methyltransferase domain-containing protein n=1 Tax=Cristinia sonorae TaxID=1940300 RepID=A0A8K0UKC3_9AGAR|nr:methyltransferase domain-containing protein [Cristinia sonorae]